MMQRSISYWRVQARSSSNNIDQIIEFLRPESEYCKILAASWFLPDSIKNLALSIDLKYSILIFYLVNTALATHWYSIIPAK
jgi:hypothetical protein